MPCLEPLQRQLSRWLDTIAPRECRLCRLPSDSGHGLCTTCSDELWRNVYGCRRCALPPPATGTEPAVNRLCPACLDRPPRVTRVIAPFIYDEALAYLISHWKYHRDRHLVHSFAALWLTAVDELPPVDLLLPVPLHWRRRFWRGFNQSEDLLWALQRTGGTVTKSRIRGVHLRRLRAGDGQARHGRQERLQRLRGAYRVAGRRGAQAAIEGASVALIDDVCTTGATADAAAEALLQAGACEVQLWCIARTPRH